MLTEKCQGTVKEESVACFGKNRKGQQALRNMVKNEANMVQQKKSTNKWMIEQIPGRISKYNRLILSFKQKENCKIETVLVMNKQISYEFHWTALTEHPGEQGFIKIQ